MLRQSPDVSPNDYSQSGPSPGVPQSTLEHSYSAPSNGVALADRVAEQPCRRAWLSAVMPRFSATARPTTYAACHPSGGISTSNPPGSSPPDVPNSMSVQSRGSYFSPKHLLMTLTAFAMVTVGFSDTGIHNKMQKDLLTPSLFSDRPPIISPPKSHGKNPKTQ